MKFQDLLAYCKSFDVAMKVFDVSKSFPKETYSLTDQVRRSSRSVTMNIAEAYRKRSYPKHFINKLTHSDSENSETQGWFEFALACEYINQPTFDKLNQSSEEVGKLIIYYMIKNPEKFGSK